MREAMKNLIKFGNIKLPKTTMIFNLGPAATCPAKKLGLCAIANDCYALKPETNSRTKKVVCSYRERQKEYWLKTPAPQIIAELDEILSKKRIKTTLFRYNEAGDFFNQGCVQKLSIISRWLMAKYNIITYGYSARSDLSFKNAHFLCKGSGHNKGNNGMTIVIGKNDKTPRGFFRCPGDCHKCSACTSGVNIAFPKH
jgi:hypothetical protein